MSTVATGPRPLSRRASRTTPFARRVGSARSSRTSDCRASISSSWSSPSPVFAETFTQMTSPPKSFGHEVVLGQALLRLLRICITQIDLVDRHQDRAARSLGVLDGLDGLRHHAVVGRDDEHDDVGDRGAARAHGSKGRVARRVDEGQLLLTDLHLVGADVLGDPSSLALGHAHLDVPDAIEQGGLAVIDVSHHRNDGRAGHEIARVHDGFGFLAFRRSRLEEGLLLESDVLHLEAELRRDLLTGLHVDRLIDGDHDAKCHQLALDRRRLGAQQLRELAYADLALDLDQLLLLPGRLGNGRRGQLVPAFATWVHHLPVGDGRGAARRCTPPRNLTREALLLLQVYDLPHTLALTSLAVGSRRLRLGGLRLADRAALGSSRRRRRYDCRLDGQRLLVGLLGRRGHAVGCVRAPPPAAPRTRAARPHPRRQAAPRPRR